MDFGVGSGVSVQADLLSTLLYQISDIWPHPAAQKGWRIQSRCALLKKGKGECVATISLTHTAV